MDTDEIDHYHGVESLTDLDREMEGQGYMRLGYVSNIDTSWKMQRILDSAPYREVRLVHRADMDLVENVDVYIVYGIKFAYQSSVSSDF